VIRIPGLQWVKLKHTKTSALSQSCQSNCEQATGGTQGQLELEKWSLDAAPPPFFNHGHIVFCDCSPLGKDAVDPSLKMAFWD
jgi:hypothetical protein